MEYKYWAFISYSHADQKWADWLHRGLEGYRVPAKLRGQETERGYAIPGRILPVFRDVEELPGSSNLSDNINVALAESLYLIVICSPRSAASHWVGAEIKTFKALGRESQVLAIIVDGEPNATDKPGMEHLECFPEALRYQVGPDGGLLPDRAEPIAPDARPGRGGREKAKLKLIAGILGVGFDELAQREKQRQRRRVLLLTAAAIFAAAALFGFYRFEQAQAEQRIEAQQAVARKEMAAEQAEKARELAAQKAEAAARAKKLADQQELEKKAKLGREALLEGNNVDAAKLLADAHRAAPQDVATQVMLSAALNVTGPLESDVDSGLAEPVVAVQNAAKGLLLARDITNGKWCVYDLGTGKQVAASPPGRPGATNAVRDVQFSPSGDALLIAGIDNVQVQPLPQGSPRVLTPAAPGGIITAAFFSIDGTKVYASYMTTTAQGDSNSKLLAWDIASGASRELLATPAGFLDTLITVDAGEENIVVRRDPIQPATVSILKRAHGKVLCWNLKSGAAPSSVDFDPLTGKALRNADGSRFVLLGNGEPSVFDSDGKLIFTLPHPKPEVHPTFTEPEQYSSAAWLPSGKTLLSSGKGAQLWDATNGQLLASFPDAVGNIDDYVTDLSEKYLALTPGNMAFSQQPPAAIYERSSGRLLATLPGVTHVSAFSPDGTKLYDVGTRFRVWNWQASRPEVTKLAHHTAQIDSLAFNALGTRLAAVSSMGKSASVWDVATGTMICSIQPAPPLLFDFLRVAFCPDGKSVLTTDSTLGQSPTVVWNGDTGAQVRQITFQQKTQVGDSTFTANVMGAYITLGAHQMFGGTGGVLAFWNGEADAATLDPPVKTISSQDFAMNSIALDPAQDELALGSEAGAVRVYKTGGDLAGQFSAGGAVMEIELSSKGGMLALDDKSLCHVWSVSDPKSGLTLNGKTALINDAHFLPDGSAIVTGDVQACVQLWDAQTGQPVGNALKEGIPANDEAYLGPPIDPNARRVWQGVVAVAASPDGKLIVGALADGRACVWERTSGAQLLRHKFNEAFSALAISPDGNVVALGTTNGDIFLWNIARENRPPDQVDAAVAKISAMAPPAPPSAPAMPPPFPPPPGP
jgi:WD40 repeat protein